MPTLQIFHRPVSQGARVSPAGLCQYRETHQYLGPGCLCPLLQLLSEEPKFTETAIYLTMVGHYKGEYVAECAKGQCGYLGESACLLKYSSFMFNHCPVPLERVYSMRVIPVKAFPLQG